MAPILFNLVLESVIRRVEVDISGDLSYKSRQLAGYADDINCLARFLSELEETFKELDGTAKEVGLRINEDKTKILVMSRKRKEIRQTICIITTPRGSISRCCNYAPRI